MPGTIIATTVIATKMASGTVQFQFLRAGGVALEVVMPAADVTSVNTTVNGGAAGATVTLNYTQDQNKGDYHNSYFQEI